MRKKVPSDISHVPVTVSERLHFLVKQELSQRPRIFIRNAKRDMTRKVTIHRFLDWLVVSALESKGFKKIDQLAAQERVPMRFAIRLAYDFINNQAVSFGAYLRANAPKVSEELSTKRGKKSTPA